MCLDYSYDYVAHLADEFHFEMHRQIGYSFMVMKRFLYQCWGDKNMADNGRPYLIQFYVYAPTTKQARLEGKKQVRNTFRQIKRDAVTEDSR